MSLLDIYRARRRLLERYVQRLLGNADEAAEVSQEAFLRVYAAELGEQTPVSEALLYTVARNLALTELRKRIARATDAVGEWDDLRVEDTGPSVEALIQQRQRVAAVEAAMERMAPKCLEVFRMRKVDNLSHAEIARRLDISPKTVERHITRALQLCHEAMAEHDGELQQQHSQRREGQGR